MTKKKKGKFNKVSQVKKMSRVAIGPVPPTKVIPHKNREGRKRGREQEQEYDG